MSAEGKSSGYISMPNLMPFLPSDLSANAQKPNDVVNERTDEWVAGGYFHGPLNLVQGKNVVKNEYLEL